MNTQKTGKAYWRSLDELADTPEFRRFVDQEFADYTPEEVIASPTRRSLLKLMGASMALAGVSGLGGCRRWPEKEVAPYASRPEGRIPGVPDQYATVMELGGVALPLLASSFDGRPTKVEGNPTHPQSRTRGGDFALGACNVFAQASTLEMYDPHRSRFVLHKGKQTTWKDFAGAASGLTLDGEFAVLCEQTSSPSVDHYRRKLTDAGAAWYTWEPINNDNTLAGTEMAFGGKSYRRHLHLDKAHVIACFDADPLGSGMDAQANARDWAAGRRTVSDGKMSRMYCVESRMSVTGTNADNRLPLKSTRMIDAIQQLAQLLGLKVKPSHELDAKAVGFLEAMAKDLKSHEGHGVVIVGESQPREVHAAAHLINEQLKNIGTTVTFTPEPEQNVDQAGQISELVAKINAGDVQTLLILGGNPVYNAPADLKFADAIKKVPTSIHLSLYVDETSKRATWHVPRSHYLESWGDARSYDGTVSVQQPLIHPLSGESRTAAEVLAVVTHDDVTAGHDIVRRTFKQWLPADNFGKSFRKVLHDGLLEGSAWEAASVEARYGLDERVAAAKSNEAEIELVITGDANLYDGRFANNGWLQEMPDPITKVTWDNALLVGPATAKKLGLRQSGRASVKVGGAEVVLGVYIQPGMAAVALGYGRASAGYVGDGVGFDTYQLRRSDALGVATDVSVARASGAYKLVSVQDHWAIDSIGDKERSYRATHHLVKSETLAERQHKHDDHGHGHGHFGQHAPMIDKKGPDGTHLPLQIFDEPIDFEKQRHRWAMAIDLNTCIGCGSCIIACQSENNIPVVGKDQVGRGREMHWLRVDRYFHGDPEDPKVVHQPLTCHQCETAPCEQVCPVAATVHDTEGINVMIYNRCIGTRYCSNNCPYKVRRFNWFDWNAKPVHSSEFGGTWVGIPDEQQRSEKLVDPVRRMQFNPEVTVRMRGVMEKCTFCLQRIKAVTIPAKNEGRPVAEGEITPACAQTCATQSIVFGDLNDADSQVSKLFKSDDAYEVLKELNVRARTRYLTRVTNPGVEDDHGSHGHEKSHSNHG